MSGNTKDFKVKNGIKPTVYHEAVGTVVSESVAYNLAAASYDSVSFSVTAEGEVPSNIFFKPDGTKMYVVGNGGDAVNEYNLSTAWDISTSSFVQTFSVATQETNPFGLFFKPDGTKMYVVGAVGDDVNEYNLSTAWDISTASYSQLFSVATEETNPSAIFFKNDGTKMYILGATGDDVNEYNLSTAWDISTASYSQLFSVATEDTGPRSLFIKPDGTSMFILGSISDTVYEYTLSTAWDISTASLYSSFAVTAQTANPSALFFNSDGTKMYISDFITYDVLQYSTVSYTQTLDLSTGSVFEITPTSDIQVTMSNPADSGIVSGATLLLGQEGYGGYDIANAVNPNISLASANDPTGIVFNSDGTKMFVGQFDIDSVVEYTLSTAWDITTASITHTFSILSEDTWIGGLAFKTDGTSMYITGRSADKVYQYTLSTAWDLSTATYASKTLYLGSQGGQPYGLAFSADGTRVSVQNDTNTIYEYTLSTAWDVSTGSYASASFSFASQSAGARSFAWNTDGTKMFLNSYGDDTVYQYSLSTAYRPSTASYDGVSYAYGALTTSTGIAFGDNGSKMYLSNYSPDSIHQYTTKIPATITYDSTIQWAGGTAPTSPAVGDTDVLTFSTRDGGTTYNAALAIDGAQ